MSRSESVGPTWVTAAQFDGGRLDCGNGLLLLIRQHLNPLAPGQILEIKSSEPSVRVDLPAWCRLTANPLLGFHSDESTTQYFVQKGDTGPRSAAGLPRDSQDEYQQPTEESKAPHRPTASDRPRLARATSVQTDALLTPHADVGPLPTRPTFSAAPSRPADHAVPTNNNRAQSLLNDHRAKTPLPHLACMGIGSWPRPAWMREALRRFRENRISRQDFAEAADDAVRLSVAAQQRAGVDVLTDGEQRRDDYASFVAHHLHHCQLIPITDILTYVDDPDEFSRSLAALDVPANQLLFPAVTGPLTRRSPLAADDLLFLKQLADRPCKVSLPGAYLLSRTMWLECVSDRFYASRDDLATDLVRILREEIAELLDLGADLIQIDEPVLTEVVHGRTTTGGRTFMCGALGKKRPIAEELAFAETLLQQVTAGYPRERLALHICRGNWTPDERAALSGDYGPLVGFLERAPVGTLFLEFCTSRAGDYHVVKQLPESIKLGIGVVNQKQPTTDSVEQIVSRARRAIDLFGANRVLLTPDCGFATFAENPVNSREIAEAHLRGLATASRYLRLSS